MTVWSKIFPQNSKPDTPEPSLCKQSEEQSVNQFMEHNTDYKEHREYQNSIPREQYIRMPQKIEWQPKQNQRNYKESNRQLACLINIYGFLFFCVMV